MMRHIDSDNKPSTPTRPTKCTCICVSIDSATQSPPLRAVFSLPPNVTQFASWLWRNSKPLTPCCCNQRLDSPPLPSPTCILSISCKDLCSTTLRLYDSTTSASAELQVWQDSKRAARTIFTHHTVFTYIYQLLCRLYAYCLQIICSL